jgi:hypothetical protein
VNTFVNVQDIAAIPTEYMGTVFKSRLEARWAVFFDFMNIKWEYEPQCFEKEYERVIKYLPDFYLPEFDCWAEVKGTQNNLNADWDSKMKHILDYDPSPIYNSVGTGRGFIILGSIPVYNQLYNQYIYVLPSFTAIQHREGLWGGYCTFFSGYCNLVNSSLIFSHHEFSMFGSDEYPVLENRWKLCDQNFNGSMYISESVKICFDTARNWDFVKEECQ